MEFWKKNLWIAAVVCGLIFTSCGKDDEPAQSAQESLDIAKNIVGNWLLATSTSREWVTFEFTATSRVNATTFENNRLQTGTGFYFVKEDKSSVSGSYDYGGGQLPVYFDWIVEKVKAFEFSIKLYDDNVFLGNTSLYRIVANETLEEKQTSKINFKAVCGTDQVSDFKILDTAVASVSSEGEISGHKIGETYMTFNTPGGYAALKIEITPAPKTFAEQVLGTWIYENLKEKEWQSTTYVADGFVDIKWTNPLSFTTIETASGYYTLSDNNCSFTVTTPYHTSFYQLWETEEITDFIWSYKCFDSEYLVGTYTGHRLLGSVTLKPGDKSTPGYADLTYGYDIVGFSCNNTSVAKVDPTTGEITAIAKGKTYVNINTAKGAGYFEVIVNSAD